MKSIYEECPVLEGERYLLRLVKMDDTEKLLQVYSDEKSVPYFNSDNCYGDDFYYTTYDGMKEAVKFWLDAYNNKGFVRFSIIDKNNKNSCNEVSYNINSTHKEVDMSLSKPSYTQDEVIGTIELFNRKAEDYFYNCGLLRLDLRSDYENEECIYDILSVIINDAFELFLLLLLF